MSRIRDWLDRRPRATDAYPDAASVAYALASAHAQPPGDAGETGEVGSVPEPGDAAGPARAGAPGIVPARPTGLLQRDRLKRRAMVSALVVADRVRCVECGICSYNCPLGIDVRSHVRLELPVSDRRCLTCGECVARCPRGTLRFEESSVFRADGVVDAAGRGA